tara:strand:+ start:83 stop:265 length:183 start_codon:yes stop_codon:yes gene_type:complete
MKELPKKAFQFEENPKIKDMIKVLKQAEALGYTRVKPYMIEGDYKHETMDLEKLLRIYLF